MAAASQRARLFLMEREHAPGHPRILQSAAHQAGRAHRSSVVGEADGTALGELDHVGELLAFEAGG